MLDEPQVAPLSRDGFEENFWSRDLSPENSHFWDSDREIKARSRAIARCPPRPKMPIQGVSGSLSSAGAAGSWRGRIRDSQIGLGEDRTAIARNGRGLGPILPKESQHGVAEMSRRDVATRKEKGYLLVESKRRGNIWASPPGHLVAAAFRRMAWLLTDFY